MARDSAEIQALAELLEAFNRSSATMEEAYRLLEARVRDLDQELNVTNDYLSNLLESMSDGVMAVDTQGHIVRFNRAATTILGFNAEELEGQPFDKVFEREFAAPKMPGTMELRAKSGRHVPVSERDAPINDHRGRKLGSVKVFQDLSELTALREQVRQIDRLAAIGEMAATVAHEIRNPLGGIKGFATFLSQDIPPEDPRRRLVDKILEGTRRLDRVVNELLAYTRPVELHLRPVACAAVVEAAVLELEYDARRIAIVAEVEPELKMLADADRVRQLLGNLLSNAIQSIAERGEVSVNAAADGGHIVIVCRDTGCGMDGEQIKRVFSPFYTTKEKGTGLGLAICQKIAEGHGGGILVESEPGAGSVFTVRLPRAE
jgi:PAS domain S-box-containing protein